jgi:hypothetical protein
MAKFDAKKEEKKVIKSEPTVSKEAETPKASIVKTPKVVADFSGDQKVVPSFKAKTLAVKYSEESLPDRVSQFNREVLGGRFTQRNTLVEKAMMQLGGDVKEITGLNINEVAFEISGVRVPSEGFYMIR